MVENANEVVLGGGSVENVQCAETEVSGFAFEIIFDACAAQGVAAVQVENVNLGAFFLVNADR